MARSTMARHRPSDRAGARLRRRAADRALGRVPGGDGRGERACSAANIMPPTRSTRSARPPECINTDVMGVLGPARDFSFAATRSSACSTSLIDEGAKRGRRYLPDPRRRRRQLLPLRPFHFRQGRRSGDDASRPGDDLVNGGVARGKAWSANYTANMYHQPADEFRPSWDFTGMAQDAELLHAVGLRPRQQQGLAELERRQRVPAVRDAERRASAAPATRSR